MGISQFESFLITMSFIILCTVIIVLGIHFIFRKNILIKNYVFLGITAFVTLVSYYRTFFENGNSWMYPIFSTLVLIGLIRPQWINRKKVKNNNCPFSATHRPYAGSSKVYFTRQSRGNL